MGSETVGIEEGKTGNFGSNCRDEKISADDGVWDEPRSIGENYREEQAFLNTMMRAECLVRTSIPDHPWPSVINDSQDNGKKEFPCPLCAYATPYRHRYMEHLSTHYSDKCTLCDFTGQSAQDLRNHLQDAHNISDIEDLSDPQDNNSDYQDDDDAPNKRGKSKSFKCKQCSYVTTTKLDFWEHSKGHIKAEKLLTCPKCPFVTEYKHHLEYHLRNHFGSKPFKCSKCSYSCVNKSMLNSHLKSHSNVYQYRCSDCAYATKYCHSLKLHLRKYQHKPAMVLNADGSPNPLPIIDIYGTRRGPKQKPKTEEVEDKSAFLDIKVPTTDKSVPNLPGGVIVPNAPQISPRSPGSIYSLNNNDIKEESQNGNPPKFYYCNICEFYTVAPEILSQHVFLHAAETNLAQMFKTNNNLQDQAAVKDYFQNVFDHSERFALGDGRSDSPLSLVSPKTRSPDPKRTASPLDLSKQDNCESENDTSQESKQAEQSSARADGGRHHRRKGKAYKLERINERFESSPEDFYGASEEDPFKIRIPDLKAASPTREDEDVPSEGRKRKEDGEAAEESPKRVKAEEKGDQPQQGHQPQRDASDGELHTCSYCDIAFKDIIMYTMHMGYHGYQDPFTCNMCGHVTPDKNLDGRYSGESGAHGGASRHADRLDLPGHRDRSIKKVNMKGGF